MTNEKDIIRASENRTSNPKSKCAICKEKIVGKAWRIGGNRYACTRCNNETPGE